MATVRIADSPKVTTYLRWMIRRDIPAMLAIENANFEFPWSEDDFSRCLRQRNAIGMSAMDDANEKLFGYMIYELHKGRLHILNFAVHAAMHRKGIGAAMVKKLAGKLSPQRRSRIMVEVRETNLDAQLFFRAMGFRCVDTLRDFYPMTPEDAYLFQLRYAP